MNVVLCGVVGYWHVANDDDELHETRLFGEENAKNKIAVVRIEGVLLEGMTHFAIRQIEQAAKDDKVKAVVVRIDSPGGTVSASEEIHQLLTRLRDGKFQKYPGRPAKKLVASFGSIAASGGYYIAMPAETIVADPVCITGSIGVYASLPNVAELINRNGIKFELIKAGGIKAAGSPFHELTPQERQPWQEMVDSSYDHFLDVVAQGRPGLSKAKLRSEVVQSNRIDRRDDKGNVLTDWFGRPRQVDYVRYRCDGGTFTANEALRLGLIDKIATLDAAVEAAAAASQLSKYQVVRYERPTSILSSLLGIESRAPKSAFDPQILRRTVSPQLWYLSSQADWAGMVAQLAND